MGAIALTADDRRHIAAYIGSLIADPNPANQAVPYNSTGVSFALPNLALSSIIGSYTGVATVTSPTKGSVSFNGLTATYIPAAGQYGADSFTYNATGPAGTSNVRTVTLVIANPPAPVISSAASKSGVVGTAFSYTTVASNSPSSYGATGLPTGLKINALNGRITGIPTVSGTFNVTLSATNVTGTGTKALTLNIAPTAPVITSTGTASATAGASFLYIIRAKYEPTTYGATGLPAGLKVSTLTGRITGIPTVSGTFNVTISASNATGTGTLPLTLTIAPTAPVITSASTASATVGTAFLYAIRAKYEPASYGATGLPAGLKVSALYGRITGTPTVSGTFNVTISATNSVGTGTQALTLTVAANAQKAALSMVDPVTSTATEPATTTTAAEKTPVLYASSYRNAKDQNLMPVQLPAEALAATAYTRANFKGDNRFSLFTAHPTYDRTKPVDQATASVFSFWSQNADGSFTKEKGLIDNPAGCIAPRKAIVADFNSDRKPDVLVACEGYARSPFPGERMYLVESSASGVYTSRPFGSFIGTFQSAAAADLDKDGLTDVVAVDGKNDVSLRVFKNAGNGKFTELPNALPSSLSASGYLAVEVLDMNRDGNVDILLGGREHEGIATLAIYGNGSGSFVNGAVKILPAATDAGIVLDFVKIGRVLHVGRATPATAGMAPRAAVQSINLDTNTTTGLLVKDKLPFDWLIPNGSAVSSDRLDRPF